MGHRRRAGHVRAARAGAALAGAVLLTSWVPATAAQASPVTAPAETVTVTWPTSVLAHLDLSRGAANVPLVLRSLPGDAPIAVSDLAVTVSGAPAEVYLRQPATLLQPGRPVTVLATVIPSTGARPTLPAHARLSLSGTLRTRTVTVTLSDAVLFATGDWRLESGALQALQGLLGEVQHFSGQVTSLTVTGFADAQPDAAISNQALSLDRANAVASWLERRGVRGNIVHTAGAGATDFVASNATATGRQANRRVVVDIALSRAVPPAFADASATAVVVAFPGGVSRAVRAAAPPHRTGSHVPVIAGVGGVAAVVVGALLVVWRRRRSAGGPKRPVDHLPRWDRRRIEADRRSGAA